jgi:hypothetical protein
VPITVQSDAPAAIRKERSFTRLSDALDEVIECRIWGGIHFRHADVEGTEIGGKVVKWMDHHYFGRA